MSQILRAADTVYALRFLRLFTMPWKKTEAYKEGLIDDRGRKIKSADTSAEKAAYTIFHRLVFNLRRLIQKVPGVGKLSLTNYLSAFWLIRESKQLNRQELHSIMEQIFDCNPMTHYMNEDTSLILNENDVLPVGTYRLRNTVLIPKTYEPLALSGSLVLVKENLEPIDYFFGVPIFRVYHLNTCRDIFVTEANLQAESLTESMTTAAVATYAEPLGQKKRIKKMKVPANLFRRLSVENAELDLTDETQLEIYNLLKYNTTSSIAIVCSESGSLHHMS